MTLGRVCANCDYVYQIKQPYKTKQKRPSYYRNLVCFCYTIFIVYVSELAGEMQKR